LWRYVSGQNRMPQPLEGEGEAVIKRQEEITQWQIYAEAAKGIITLSIPSCTTTFQKQLWQAKSGKSLRNFMNQRKRGDIVRVTTKLNGEDHDYEWERTIHQDSSD